MLCAAELKLELPAQRERSHNIVIMISGASRNGPSKTGTGAVRINSLRRFLCARRAIATASFRTELIVFSAQELPAGAVGLGHSQRADGLRLVSSAAG